MDFFWNWLFPIFITLGAIGVADYKAPKDARWFYLHCWINLWNLIYAAPDIYDSVVNPYYEFIQPWSSTYPFAIVAAGHFYHILFFPKLSKMDWLHHITMIFITLPWTVYFFPMKGANLAISGLSGFPGGVDYVLCTFAKLSWISWETEKHWNNYIQVWLRAPWLIYTCSIGWCFWTAGKLSSYPLVSLIFVFWNACFFMQDTLRANYRREGRKQIQNSE